MITPALQALIDRLVETLSADARIDAVALSGSLARDEGDAFSDVDLVCAVEGDDLEACLAEYSGSRNPLGPTVLLRVEFGRVVIAVTPHWERYDIHFATLPEYRGMAPEALRPLFTRPGAPQPAGTGPRIAPVSAARLTGRIEEFLRILGLLPVAVGRQEWLVSQEGFFLMRRMLVDMMVEANGLSGARGGVKRLNAFLTAEQRATLEALTPPAATREALIAANVELTRLFLPLARQTAAADGAEWPVALERATRRHLEGTLGLSF